MAAAGWAFGYHHLSCFDAASLTRSQSEELGGRRSGSVGAEIAVAQQNSDLLLRGSLCSLREHQQTRIQCGTLPYHSNSHRRHYTLSNHSPLSHNHSQSIQTELVSSIVNHSRSSNSAVATSRIRKTQFFCCNAAQSLGFPSASDVDTWRLIVERVTVIIAILVAQLAGSSQPVWRLGLPNRVPLTPSNQSSSEAFLSQTSSLSFATSADWGGPWGGEWDGATSSDSATSAESQSERRATGETASTSDTADAPFPPRIWGDITDKLRAPLVARRGRQVETMLAKAPEMSVQGLAREPRRQLFSAALGSLRRGVESLPDHWEELSMEDWENACEGVLVDAVSRTKSAWLGETDGTTELKRGVGGKQVVASQSFRAEEPATAVGNETSAGGNWIQKVFGLGGTEGGKVDFQSGRETVSMGGLMGAEASTSEGSEKGPRFEFGGWAAPAFRTGEDTDSKRGRELPAELASMAEKLPLYEELLFYLRFKACSPDTRLPQGAFARFAPRALEDLVLAIADSVASDCMSQVGYNPRKPVNSVIEEGSNLQRKGVNSSRSENMVSEGLEGPGGSRAETVGLAGKERGSGGQTRRLAQQGLGSAGEEFGLEGQTQRIAEQPLGLASDEKRLAEQARRLEQLMQRYLHPRLRSTRALERFRNEVSIRRFLRTQLSSVAAMYEDRYELWGLRRQPIAGSSETIEDSKTTPRTQRRAGPLPNFPGLNILGRKRRAEKVEEDWEVVVVGQRMPCRRIEELRRLAGWQLRYSMALEFLDVAAPVLNALLAKLGDWISFLLVTMIGRSLGLVYKGIKQSLKRP